MKEIGVRGFTREIEEDLLSGRIDIAVHSMKDMPTEQPVGLILDTYLPREDVRDAFVSLTKNSMDALEAGQKLGSSSLRRKAQLMLARPDLEVVEFRGNVQTRLKKLEDGVADATFLAAAGLNRLGLSHIAKSFLDPDVMLPAVARAIGIERRSDDTRVAEILSAIHDTPTGHRLAAERAFLRGLDGSCETPIAGLLNSMAQPYACAAKSCAQTAAKPSMTINHAPSKTRKTRNRNGKKNPKQYSKQLLRMEKLGISERCGYRIQ